MRVSNYLYQLITDKLNDYRIVVWYDGEQAFSEYAATFKAAHCRLVLATESRLRARQEAEAIYRQMNASSSLAASQANLLIYLPFSHAEGEARLEDPFEVFAVAGTTFGAQESEKLASLAYQALPSDLAEQIERLFRESQPTLAMLDRLDQQAAYPLVKQALGSQSAVEVVVQLLGQPDAPHKVSTLPGCEAELLRLLADELGYQHPSSVRRGTGGESDSASHPVGDPWLPLARYILFSEFAFDLPGELPAALTNLPRADVTYRERINTIAERLRDSLQYRDRYLDLATQIETALKLPLYFAGATALGQRDTFAFTERQHLAALTTALLVDRLTTAQQIIEARRQSIWRHQPERAQIWKVAERCVSLLETATRVEAAWLEASQSVATMVTAYSQPAGWSDLDRQQRLLEQSIAECTETEMLDEVIERCRARYRQVSNRVQNHFMDKVEAQGWPPEGLLRQAQIFDRLVGLALANREKVAYFMTDSLRFEMGRDLLQILNDLGEANLQPALATLPTVTSVGMAALLPGADGLLSLRQVGQEYVPHLGEFPLRKLDEREKFLTDKLGDRVVIVEMSEFLSLSTSTRRKAQLKQADLVVMRDSRIDNFGENIPLREVRKYLTDLLGDLKAAVIHLIRLGYNYIVIATDHGHLLFPEILPGDVIAEAPPGQWLLSKRRSLLGQKVGERSGSRVFNATKIGIQGDATEWAVPNGFGVYSRGSGYFHGGLSLQEGVLPVITLRAKGRPAEQGADDIELRYRSDKFTSRVIGLKVWFNSLVSSQIRAKVEAFAGSAPGAPRVGEATDCDARDEVTHEVTLVAKQETAVPLLLDPDFEGKEIEIRVTDPETPIVWARLTLKNGMLD